MKPIFAELVLVWFGLVNWAEKFYSCVFVLRLACFLGVLFRSLWCI